MSPGDYTYDLPPELIAQDPPAEREASRLLVVARGGGVLGRARVRRPARPAARRRSPGAQRQPRPARAPVDRARGHRRPRRDPAHRARGGAGRGGDTRVAGARAPEPAPASRHGAGGVCAGSVAARGAAAHGRGLPRRRRGHRDLPRRWIRRRSPNATATSRCRRTSAATRPRTAPRPTARGTASGTRRCSRAPMVPAPVPSRRPPRVCTSPRPCSRNWPRAACGPRG